MKERIEAAIARIEQGVHTGAGHFFGHATVILRGIVEDLEDTVEMVEADIAPIVASVTTRRVKPVVVTKPVLESDMDPVTSPAPVVEMPADTGPTGP